MEGFPKMELVGDTRTITYHVEFNDMKEWFKKDRVLSEFTGEDDPILQDDEVREFLAEADPPEEGWKFKTAYVYPPGWVIEYTQNFLKVVDKSLIYDIIRIERGFDDEQSTRNPD